MQLRLKSGECIGCARGIHMDEKVEHCDIGITYLEDLK
jgi:hypothetical protein